MQSYAAIDLHSNNGVLTVIDENDRVLKQKKLANRLQLFPGRARTVPRDAPGGGRRINIQLVLACRWPARAQISRDPGEHRGHPAIFGTEALG